MAADGRPAIGAPRPHQLWGLSVVLRGSSADGDVFFKCSADVFRHEAVVTQALAARMPDLVPEVVAVDDAEGWLLMRDLGATELGEQDESLWHEGVRGARRYPAVVAGPDRRAGRPRASGPVADRPGRTGRGDDRRTPCCWRGCPRTCATGGWRRRRPWSSRAGASTRSGRARRWSTATSIRGTSPSARRATRVFDWTDAAVSHPFVDLATYVFRTDDLPYAGTWSTPTSRRGPTRPRRVASRGGSPRPGRRSAVPGADLPRTPADTDRDGADDGIAGADLDWIHRSLTRHERGLDSPT